jgi:hypothetical protein
MKVDADNIVPLENEAREFFGRAPMIDLKTASVLQSQSVLAVDMSLHTCNFLT